MTEVGDRSSRYFLQNPTAKIINRCNHGYGKTGTSHCCCCDMHCGSGLCDAFCMGRAFNLGGPANVIVRDEKDRKWSTLQFKSDKPSTKMFWMVYPKRKVPTTNGIVESSRYKTPPTQITAVPKRTEPEPQQQPPTSSGPNSGDMVADVLVVLLGPPALTLATPIRRSSSSTGHANWITASSLTNYLGSQLTVWRSSPQRTDWPKDPKPNQPWP